MCQQWQSEQRKENWACDEIVRWDDVRKKTIILSWWKTFPFLPTAKKEWNCVISRKMLVEMRIVRHHRDKASFLCRALEKTGEEKLMHYDDNMTNLRKFDGGKLNTWAVPWQRNFFRTLRKWKFSNLWERWRHVCKFEGKSGDTLMSSFRSWSFMLRSMNRMFATCV